MTKRALFILATVTLFTMTAAVSFGDVRRERTVRRPYIVEVGEPYSITMATVRHEAVGMSELGEYLHEYGYPDFAEVQEIEPEWPWETYEVRLYYLRRNLETDFGHVMLSAAMPNLGVLKYVGDIAAEKRHQIEVILQARLTPPPLPPPVVEVAVAPATHAEVAAVEKPSSGGLTEALVARIEAAAERAAQAADRAAEQSEAAVRAADLTVSIVEKIVQSEGAR